MSGVCRAWFPLFLLAILACAQSPDRNPDAARQAETAARVTIIRDDWGIPHVYGRSDADAVFGMIYAQAEDDFNRIETNYLNAMGRLAEAEGASAVFSDLRMKMFIRPEQLQAQYETSPEWLKQLMTAWADGLNYYLATHPQVTPRVIRRFEPWMALSFTEGSIGGDIESISLRRLEAFYGETTATTAMQDPTLDPEPRGSNGIAIAPSRTAAGRALLLINPHTSFFFRAELQVASEEGLNAYGAATWGQFFIYQGFNDRVGWMHTSSGVDAIDEYAETIVRRGDSLYARYGGEEMPLAVSTIAVPFRTDTGMAERVFPVYRTRHGPIVREADGKWISVRLMEEPVRALTQSWSRTKARTYRDFVATVDLRTNSSNNTVYADADGNIAYFQAGFVPRRDPTFDWTRPVDGSNPATDWGDLLRLDELPNLHNPATGWIQNTNNWPYSAAGPASPRQRDYPRYVDTYGENPRGVHAIRLLEGKRDFTLESLRAAAYDSYQPAFATLVPRLLTDFDRLRPADPLRARLAGQIALLRDWDYRWSAGSVPTTLAVYWGDDLWDRVQRDAASEDLSVYEYLATRVSGAERLASLARASARLTADFGTWQTPWGEINRFQRLTGDIVQPFSDSGPSIPVPFASARWGSLASFGAATRGGSKRRYGTSGNSFVAVVEFGDSVRARAVTAGGLSGDPHSRHFNDQAERYASGDLREVYFYRSQLEGHIEREYRPGE